jgi:hypothetical protein
MDREGHRILGMIVLDHPPAIIHVRPLLDLQLAINGERLTGRALPRDFLELPKALRRAVPPDALRGYLPAEYRRLSDGMLATLLYGNIGGLPGVVMAGGGKLATLFTETGIFRVPGDWNKRDNIVQGVGRGGTGHGPTASALVDDAFYGGTGGGGSVWAALVNKDFTIGLDLGVTIATTSGNTSISTGELVAASGANGGSISGGDGSGGAGGSVANSTGDQKFAGFKGGDIHGAQSFQAAGADGGACAGPHGDGAANGVGDAGFGGKANGGDGTAGASGGWNAGGKVNAGSGGGGFGGPSTNNPPNGTPGGDYGAGGGGGGVFLRPVGGPLMGSGAAGATGCMLFINNASL